MMLLLLLAGCKCKDYGEHITFTNALWADTYIDAQYVMNDSVLTGDTLYASIRLSGFCIAHQQLNNIPFISTCHATSFHCPCGSKGLREPISSIQILSDSTYASYPAGADVTHLFTAYQWTRDPSTNNIQYTYYSPNTWTNVLNQSLTSENGFSYSGLQIFCTQKPEDTLARTFTFSFTLGDTTLTSKSPPIRWN